ncbi:hypothetical protein [Taibaiella soli]|uniref:Uncharacterized protein n=1 Tax=Taibaiella soli TaxID=1649169 RepID=A0A2W2C240_9BACT|nr:hypothetical protein [Taibaiella soli]PZF74143.1 hypothetical protein DN068_03775 [Taibaiella soli]
MALKHLEELGEQLIIRKWAVEELPGDNDFYISAIWKIGHANYPGITLELVFDGMGDDLTTLPIEECYGCYVEGHSDQTLYFFDNERLWKSNLAQFLDALDQIAKAATGA